MTATKSKTAKPTPTPDWPQWQFGMSLNALGAHASTAYTECVTAAVPVPEQVVAAVAAAVTATTYSTSLEDDGKAATAAWLAEVEQAAVDGQPLPSPKEAAMAAAMATVGVHLGHELAQRVTAIVDAAALTVRSHADEMTTNLAVVHESILDALAPLAGQVPDHITTDTDVLQAGLSQPWTDAMALAERLSHVREARTQLHALLRGDLHDEHLICRHPDLRGAYPLPADTTAQALADARHRSQWGIWCPTRTQLKGIDDEHTARLQALDDADQADRDRRAAQQFAWTK